MIIRRACFTLAVIGIVIVAFSQAIDGMGSKSTEEALVRALTTFGIARALNGVISVAQGTEVAIEPAGIGVILTPGQILDPVNDLVERFSWVMLVSSASLGVLNILLSMSAWLWSSVLLCIALLITLYFYWRPTQGSVGMRVFFTRIALLLLILRFVAPVIAISNDLLYQQFLEPRYETAVMQLQQTTQQITDINNESNPQQTVAADDDLLSRARSFYQSSIQSIKQATDIKARMARYQAAASHASRHAIDLIVVFVFQTILLPIMFLWFAWHLFKWVLLGQLPVRRLLNKAGDEDVD